ncbi:hypothetical protein BRD00_08340 [Halobacteriales archaeon QS_8_69_26]|nr:MAG: hypothetical protein BRD00_08340 [Halobacteriales archaeon QS_8_69_26]
MFPDDTTRTRDDDSDLSRRSVLGALGTTVGAAIVSTGGLATSQASEEFTVRQGDRCFPITAFEGTDPVEEVYDLRIPSEFGGDNGATDPGEGPYFQSAGTEDLQRPKTTITFLYDGPRGLSLVVVHDSADGDGGSVTWKLAGVPLSADWVVKDDLYLDPDDGSEDNVDNWNVTGTQHRIDWTFSDWRTDGGALRSLGNEFSVEIQPRYNEEATLWEQFYSGRLTDWEVLSGSRSDPERHSLALDEPVTISTETCPDRLAVPLDVKPGSRTNPINPRERGVIPVAIGSTRSFDPADVDVETLRFGPPDVVTDGGGAEPAHGGHLEDELVVHFPAPATGFDHGDTRAMVAGGTTGGTPLVGTDRITTVGRRRSGRDRRGGRRGDDPPGDDGNGDGSGDDGIGNENDDGEGGEDDEAGSEKDREGGSEDDEEGSEDDEEGSEDDEEGSENDREEGSEEDNEEGSGDDDREKGDGNSDEEGDGNSDEEGNGNSDDDHGTGDGDGNDDHGEGRGKEDEGGDRDDDGDHGKDEGKGNGRDDDGKGEGKDQGKDSGKGKGEDDGKGRGGGNDGGKGNGGRNDGGKGNGGGNDGGWQGEGKGWTVTT